MPISDRDYIRGKHPPTCTCKECTERRLGRLTRFSSYKSNREPPRGTKSASLHSMGGKPLQRIWRIIPLGVHKFFLSLLVIVGLADIIRRGYVLFTQQTDPLKNTIIFLVEVGLWFWLIAILRSRRYRHRNPKFKLVFIVVIAIILVCTFAGIEPLSSYKNNLFSSISNYLEEQQTIRDAAKIAAEEARIQAEALAKAETALEEEQTITKLSQLIYQSINMERTTQGLSPLQISSTLTSLAEEHSREMVAYNYFSHDRMPGSQDFDWGLAPGAGRGENIFMMPQQLVIPGPILSPEELANEITQGWMESPGHRENILTGYFTHTGIGIAKKGIYYYITQMFEGYW